MAPSHQMRSKDPSTTIQTAHVSHARLQPILYTQSAGLPVQGIDERRMSIDRHNVRERRRGQHQCLGACPAADVKNPCPRPDVRHEPEGAPRVRRASRSLPWQPAEQLEKQCCNPIWRHVSPDVAWRQQRRFPVSWSGSLRCRETNDALVASSSPVVARRRDVVSRSLDRGP